MSVGNPVNYVDPTGLSCESSVQQAAGAIIEVVIGAALLFEAVAVAPVGVAALAIGGYIGLGLQASGTVQQYEEDCGIR